MLWPTMSVEAYRIFTLFGWLVVWLVGQPAAWLVGWLAGWLVSFMNAWLAGWLVGWLPGCPIPRIAGWLAGCPGGWLFITLKDIIKEFL